jgi:uncharacterized membrane protein
VPYVWDETANETTLRLWPHQSLTPRGMVVFLSVTALLAALPLAGLIGQGALWLILACVLAVYGGVWTAIRRNQAARAQTEVLRLTAAQVDLVRSDAGRPDRHWSANPHWVDVAMTPGGPVPAYLTMRGNGRTVELGAFLTADERQHLHDELRARLHRLRAVTRP